MRTEQVTALSYYYTYSTAAYRAGDRARQPHVLVRDKPGEASGSPLLRPTLRARTGHPRGIFWTLYAVYFAIYAARVGAVGGRRRAALRTAHAARPGAAPHQQGGVSS